MMSIKQKIIFFNTRVITQVATFATSTLANKSYQLVIVGGGTGGCSSAAKFSSKLGRGKVAVIEPSSTHYYQPMWTMVGGGMKTLQDSGRPMGEVLPKKADWIKQKVVGFKPEENKVVLEDQSEVGYDFLIVSLGLQLNYGIIKGLPEAFETPGVCSNYSPLYVNKTLEALKNFKEGNALFTLPNTAVKCAGAPQKIMYIADEYLRKNGKREKAQVRFLTAGGVIFGVKKYAYALAKLVEERDINVNFQHNLIAVRPDNKEAVFQKLDGGSDELVTLPYDMIHITPPMSAPDVLRKSTTLVDGSGFLNINKETLQHVTYPNIFGIGDCTNLPTSKTAAAAAAQVGILKTNLEQAIKGQKLTAKYDGYTSCPLVTGYSKCILAEFDFDGNPMETFPLNQAKERRSMFHMKKDFMPILYWEGMLKGLWEGPKLVRKAMHLGLSK
ncbi:UNVERIFIED_CONTAM: hypothetical protein RMT77_008138 [Armadillidium vulgare]